MSLRDEKNPMEEILPNGVRMGDATKADIEHAAAYYKVAATRAADAIDLLETARSTKSE